MGNLVLGAILQYMIFVAVSYRVRVTHIIPHGIQESMIA